MTHEELLAKIDTPCGEDYDDAEELYKKALRAVVELHKPMEFSRYCAYCVPKENYPCQTIQVIEKELA